MKESANKKIVTYKLKGEAFKEGISIYELNTALSEFQSILEKSYLSYLDKNRMTQNDKNNFKIISRDIHHGSFISNWELILEGTDQLVLPMFNTITPSDLWALTSNTFQFLKLIFTAKEEGKKVDIEVGDNNNNVNLTINRNQYEFNGPVVSCAKGSLPHYQKLNKLIDSDKIDKLEATSNNEEGVKLTNEDKNLFNISESKEETPMSLKIEIFEFNKYKNAGKLKVYPGQQIPKGEYSFSVEGNKNIEEIINYFNKDKIKANLLAEYVDDPLEGEKVSYLKLVDIVKNN